MMESGSKAGERLQKVLARAGVASRRRAEAMIAQGRVKVDGEVVTEPGTRVDPLSSRVEIDGQRIRLESHVYYLLNKPTGVVTTMKDPEGRATVKDLSLEIPERVFPVGRLDYDAEGLLILTNDGELANRLTHPRYGVSRTYDAKVRGVPSEAELDRLREGVRLEDGLARPSSVEVVGRAERNTWVRVVVAEGRHHLVKRMFEAIGHPVQRLRRISYGGLKLGDLPPGKLRPLSAKEVSILRKAANEPTRPPAGKRGVGRHSPKTRGGGRGDAGGASRRSGRKP